MPPKIKVGRTSDELKQRAIYSDEVQLRVVNLIFDPSELSFIKEMVKDEVNLLSLTRINSSREIFVWAKQIVREAALSQKRQWPLEKIFRVAFLFARRSLNMDGFKEAIKVAQEQSIAKSEDVGEEYDA